jgi:two-component system response regulator FixJ
MPEGPEPALGSSTVYVVDDDAPMRDSLCALLQSVGYTTEAFETAKAFLEHRAIPGSCLVCDVRMPEMDGMELLHTIVARRGELAVVMVTGDGDLELAVRAMNAGAVAFLEKPFDAELLFESVKRALRIAAQTNDPAMDAQVANGLLACLTHREREVFDHIVAGRSNRLTAYELGISPRTVEIHRSNIMHKLSVRNLSDLARIAFESVHPDGEPDSSSGA